MNQSNSHPMILPLPTFEMHATEAQPRILPFPARSDNVTATRISATAETGGDALRAVRDRLFRMIVAKQWDRSHGNRAS